MRTKSTHYSDDNIPWATEQLAIERDEHLKMVDKIDDLFRKEGKTLAVALREAGCKERIPKSFESFTKDSTFESGHYSPYSVHSGIISDRPGKYDCENNFGEEIVLKENSWNSVKLEASCDTGDWELFVTSFYMNELEKRLKTP